MITMIDEKNPRQNSDNDDSSDDEVIIDLTEEIDTKPKEDNSIFKLTEEMDTDDPLSLVRDGEPKTDNDENLFSFDEIDESESAEDDADRALTARIADAQEDPVEDQLIASAMDYSLGADQDDDREITEEFDLSADEDEEDIIDLDDTGREEENQNFANLILADSKKSDQENEDTDEFPEDVKEIIEITEFDQHIPADGEALLKQSGMLDSTPEDENEFNQLFDVDKDSVSADEDIIELSESPQNMDDAVLDQFFNEELKDDQPLIQASESIFNDEKEDKEFEIDLDDGAVAKQVDRLDTFLFKDSSDEPVLTALDADRPETKNTGPEDSQAAPEIDLPLALSPGQIDAAIERVISEKFSDKIEGIIYEVIEKAVSKEIHRLKKSLIGNNSIDEDQI